MTVVLRRRRLPAGLEEPFAAFRRLIRTLERAKAALTASVPGTRLPGRPLAEALLEFEEGLREVRRGMDAWRAPELEDVWLAATEGLAEATALAARVRTQASAPEAFDQLIGLIGDLLEPLEAFSPAAGLFRDLRS